MKRKLSIYQYGSEFDPSTPTRYSPNDWIEISVSESSPSEESGSIGAPPVYNSSASDASTGVLPSSSPHENFYEISRFFQGQLKEIGVDLPSNWSIEELTQFVIGEEEVLDPSYLSDIYSNLVECGFHSCYWEHTFEYIQLIVGW